MTELFTGRPKIIVEPPQDTEPRGTYDLNTALQNISFSGADAVATMIIPVIGEDGKITNDGDVIELGELQTISYSLHRENSPVRTLGHVNVRGFVKGSRTIAGSLIFTVFNEYAFYRIKKYRELLGRRNGFFAPLADMLPPFDIVISFFNEYGQSAKMKIFGITITDEGQTISIDDLITEQTYTYMARGIQPMVKMDISSEIGSTKDPAVTQRDVQISRNIFGDEAVDKISEFYNQNMVERIIPI
jgi:hypothetical protein